jgi:hypothetical protein
MAATVHRPSDEGLTKEQRHLLAVLQDTVEDGTTAIRRRNSAFFPKKIRRTVDWARRRSTTERYETIPSNVSSGFRT